MVASVPKTYTSDHTVVSEHILFADASSNSVTFTLPDATTVDGELLRFKKLDATGNAMVIEPFGAQTVDGDSSLSVVDQWTSVDIVASGSAWYIV